MLALTKGTDHLACVAQCPSAASRCMNSSGLRTRCVVPSQRLSDKLRAFSCKRRVFCSSKVVQRGLLGAMAFVVERSAIRRRWGCRPMACTKGS